MTQYIKGKQTKEILLKTAKRLFYEQGYDATTTRQIAEVSEVNLGLIKYHFESKAYIALEVYIQVRDSFDGWLTTQGYEKEERLLVGSAIEIILCFNSPNFKKFYVELYQEAKIRDYFQNRMGTYQASDHDDKVSAQLYGVAFSFMKASLMSYTFTEEGQKISMKQYIKFYMQQQMAAHNMVNADVVSEKVYEELEKYYFSVVSNFTPVIQEIRV